MGRGGSAAIFWLSDHVREQDRQVKGGQVLSVNALVGIAFWRNSPSKAK